MAHSKSRKSVSSIFSQFSLAKTDLRTKKNGQKSQIVERF